MMMINYASLSSLFSLSLKSRAFIYQRLVCSKSRRGSSTFISTPEKTPDTMDINRPKSIPKKYKLEANNKLFFLLFFLLLLRSMFDFSMFN